MSGFSRLQILCVIRGLTLDCGDLFTLTSHQMLRARRYGTHTQFMLYCKSPLDLIQATHTPGLGLYARFRSLASTRDALTYLPT